MGGRALAHLLRAGELTAAELGWWLALGPAQTLELIERLEQDGFLVGRVAVVAGEETVVFAPTPLARSALPSLVATLSQVVDPDEPAVVRRFIGEVAAATERVASAVDEGPAIGRPP